MKAKAIFSWKHPEKMLLPLKTSLLNMRSLIGHIIQLHLVWYVWQRQQVMLQTLQILIFIKMSDSIGIRTHNCLVHERTLNHLAKLPKWLSCVASTNLYGAFDCMLLCHVQVSEWIHSIVASMSRNALLETGARSVV